MKTMADVATDGLDVVAAQGVIRVRDGQDTWLARTAAYEAAVEVLTKRPVPADEDLDDAGMRAYSELCRLVSVASPVVSAIGSSRGTPEEQRGLVAVALGAELVDPDEAVVESLGEPVSPAADATEDWIPTHRITWRPASGPHVVWEVMLCDAIQVPSKDDAPGGDGPAYTREDWDRGDNASWGVVNGEWLCEGQATPGGAKGEVVVEELSDDNSPRVMDYQTGEALDGQPSPELVEASLAVPHTGAVGARRDAEGVWQLVRDDPWGPDTRTVWIQE